MNVFTSFFENLLKFVFGHKEKKLPLKSEIKNVLIVRQHNQLGDMLLSVPLFRALNENIENVKVDVVTSEVNYEVLQNNRFLNKIILFDKYKFYNPIYAIKWLNELRKIVYDLVLVPTTVSISNTSCFIGRLAKGKYYIGPGSLNKNNYKFRYLFDTTIAYDWSEYDELHVSKVILKILEPLQISTENLKSVIDIGEENEKFAFNFFKGIEKVKIGMHIGAGKIPNRWALNNFIELTKLINEKYNAFFYFTAGSFEKNIIEELEKKIKVEHKILQTSLHNIAAVVRHSDLFISNDTGIMHVAGTTETPLICLFGPTNPKSWAPIGQNVFVIKKECDIDSIKTKDVMEVIVKILK